MPGYSYSTMFTGIIETTGTVALLEKDKGNINMTIHSSVSDELKIDQSVAHNGVCLTVVATGPGWHQVTAIEETLKRSTLGNFQTGDRVNLERCMLATARFDGHIVQGHVDLTAVCTLAEDQGGSWIYRFGHEHTPSAITVEKGSICIDGVSLTVVESGNDYFSVAVIPYTYEFTSFKDLKTGKRVNLEFDIIGKYISKLMAAR